MSLKDILLGTFNNLEPVDLPPWLNNHITENESTITSYIWKTDKLRRIRLCELNIKNKFFAESLVLYPDFNYEFPILGTEYLGTSSKKYFGTIDFHPLKSDPEYNSKYIDSYLSDFGDRKKEQSKIYDLNKYFSKKLWIKSSDSCFYKEYIEQFTQYISQYKKCIENSKKTEVSYLYQKGYDYHLSSTDPAYGILKAHYNKEFAEKYIYNFLFDLH